MLGTGHLHLSSRVRAFGASDLACTKEVQTRVLWMDSITETVEQEPQGLTDEANGTLSK